jgi:thiamine transport system ATP-binding protein
VLAVRGLTVRYGSVAAVAEVDLEVPDGQVLALLGPSGCGKSTLLRAVAGLEPAAAGTVCWDGTDLARIPVHRRGFGLMFQDGVLFPHRTVAGNVVYGLRGPGWSPPARDRRVAELLELVGLAGYGARRVSTLSGGEAQRVALARALAPRPRLLLLDEPLAALDRALRERLLADLRLALSVTGTTAIFVTHDQQEAFAVADRLAVMRAGRIAQSGDPRAVWSRPVDDWVARFLGCTTVLPARPHRLPDGTWASSTFLGEVAGRAEWVGLRPSALLVDQRGTAHGTVAAVVPGPEHQVLTVQLSGPDGELPAGRVQALADPDAGLEIGSAVRLRLDPTGAALLQDAEGAAAAVAHDTLSR